MIERTKKIQSVKAEEGHGDHDEWFEGTSCVRKENWTRIKSGNYEDVDFGST